MPLNKASVPEPFMPMLKTVPVARARGSDETRNLWPSRTDDMEEKMSRPQPVLHPAVPAAQQPYALVQRGQLLRCTEWEQTLCQVSHSRDV